MKNWVLTYLCLSVETSNNNLVLMVMYIDMLTYLFTSIYIVYDLIYKNWDSVSQAITT